MQNAQMHQIIMHNMMLKAMPPMALSPPSGPSHCTTHLGQVNTHTLQHIEKRHKSLHSLQNCHPKSVFPGQLPGKPYFCKARCQTKGECRPSSSSLWSYPCSTTAASYQLPHMVTRCAICPCRTSRGASILTPCNSTYYTPTTQCVRFLNSACVLKVCIYTHGELCLLLTKTFVCVFTGLLSENSLFPFNLKVLNF